MGELFEGVEKNQYGYYELKNRATEEEITAFYTDSYYQNEMALYRKEYTDREVKEKITRLRSMQYVIENCMSMTNGEGKKFLDIGCGEGFALKYFMDKGYSVTGIEFDVWGCKYHNPEVVENVIKGNAISVLDQFDKKGYVGIILVDHVLEHVTDPRKLIHSITSISKPGTCLIISVPNDFSKTQLRLLEKGYIDDAFWVSKSFPPAHLSYFNKDTLKQFLEGYGWKMEFLMGNYPIDFNLFNKDTNYVLDRGKNCHAAALEIEELLYEAVGMEGVVDIYNKLGQAGLGRSITAYFTLQ